MVTKHKSYLDYLHEFVDLLGISTAVQIGIKPNGNFLNNLGNGFIVAFVIMTLKATIELVIKIVTYFKPKNNSVNNFETKNWPTELVQEVNKLKLNPEFFKSKIWEETIPYINEILANPILCNSLGIKPYVLIASMIRVSYEMWKKNIGNQSISESRIYLTEAEELVSKYKSEFSAISEVLLRYVRYDFDRIICIFTKLATGQVQLVGYIIRKNFKRIMIPFTTDDRYEIGDAFMSIYEKHKFRVVRLSLYNSGKIKVRFDSK